jgi:hypothetical protein
MLCGWSPLKLVVEFNSHHEYEEGDLNLTMVFRDGAFGRWLGWARPWAGPPWMNPDGFESPEDRQTDTLPVSYHMITSGLCQQEGFHQNRPWTRNMNQNKPPSSELTQTVRVCYQLQKMVRDTKLVFEMNVYFFYHETLNKTELASNLDSVTSQMCGLGQSVYVLCTSVF